MEPTLQRGRPHRRAQGRLRLHVARDRRRHRLQGAAPRSASCAQTQGSNDLVKRIIAPPADRPVRGQHDLPADHEQGACASSAGSTPPELGTPITRSTVPAKPLLRHGRQPSRLVRLARLGLRAARRHHRQGRAHLLAAVAVQHRSDPRRSRRHPLASAVARRGQPARRRATAPASAPAAWWVFEWLCGHRARARARDRRAHLRHPDLLHPLGLDGADARTSATGSSSSSWPTTSPRRDRGRRRVQGAAGRALRRPVGHRPREAHHRGPGRDRLVGGQHDLPADLDGKAHALVQDWPHYAQLVHAHHAASWSRRTTTS